MDKLEQKIQSKRAVLDHVEELDANALWQGIRQELDAPKTARRIHLVRWWAMAASVALVALIVSTVLLWKQVQEAPNKAYSLAYFSAELGEQEANYQALISEKEQNLQLDTIKREEFEALFEELDVLDTIYQEYSQQIPLYGENERLINTLIKYYELKIRVLEQLENELFKKQEYKEYEKEITI